MCKLVRFVFGFSFSMVSISSTSLDVQCHCKYSLNALPPWRQDKASVYYFWKIFFSFTLFSKCFFLLKCCCTCRVVNTATIFSCRSRLTTMTKERYRLVMQQCTVRLRVSPPVFICRTTNTNSQMDQLLSWYFSLF